ncbi:MAG: hypothetical protein C0483_20070 [Pirellula sp.]|nr:hypothetical protein [Pirellula sp.]
MTSEHSDPPPIAGIPIPGKPIAGDAVAGSSAPLDVAGRVDVPVFNCIVAIIAEAGGVRARVVNLAGLEFSAASERAALAQIVPAFKRRVVDLLQAEQPIPWIDPPPPEPKEQRRFVPVHL